MTHRVSSLPQTLFCPRAVSVGAGRSAAVSTAFHAHCSGSADAPRLLGMLTEDEQRDVEAWARPTDQVFEFRGVTVELRYEDAVKEAALAIGPDMEPLPFAAFARGEALTGGHPDMYWIRDVHGMRIAYVADIKRSEWTVTDGPESLQVHGYGFLVAAHEQCTHYMPGIWGAKEGTWQWGELVALDSPRAFSLWERIAHAARNTEGDYATGPHCGGCYNRFTCPAHMVPIAGLHESLAPLAGEGLTMPRIAQMVRDIKRAEDTIRKAKELAQAYYDWHGPIDDGSGKVWAPSECQGRVGFDLAGFREQYPELAKAFTRRGKPYRAFSWRNK